MQQNKMNKYDKIESMFIKSKKQKLLEDREELILKREGDIHVPEVCSEKSTKKAWKNLIGNYKKRVKVSPPVTSIVKILDETNKDTPQVFAVIS